jgi:phage tail-like protein
MARSVEWDVLENFRFMVQITNSAGQNTLSRAGFSQCGLPTATVAEINYREGTYRDTMEKSAGLVTYGDITLSHGVTKDQDFYSWLQQHKKSASNVRGSDGAYTAADTRPTDDAQNDYRRTVTITVLGRDSQPVKKWILYNAHIAEYVPGEALDATAEAKLISVLTIRHEGFEETILK